MPAPIFSLPVTGSDPKVTTKKILEDNINAVLASLYGEIATVKTGLNPRGGWDASSGAFPSGAAKGDYYIVSDAGTVDGATFVAGDWLVSLVDAPSTSTFAENWFRADYSQVTPKTFATIAALAAHDAAIDGQSYTVASAFNGQSETFRYDLDSTLTADGAVVVDADGMGLGQWVSKRTEYADYAEFEGEPRNLAPGTVVLIRNVGLVEVVASGGNLPGNDVADSFASKRKVLEQPWGGFNVKQFGAVGDGTTLDEAAFNAAISYIEELGGGTLNVPVGDYPVRIQYTKKNVRIVCELGTVLRGATTAAVVRIMDTVTGPNYIFGADIRGQALNQEGALLGNGYQNTKALYGFEVNGPWFTAEKCKLRAFRYDSLYGRVALGVNNGQAEFTSIDCDYGDTARNSVSLVDGHNWRFRGGSVWNEGIYYSSASDTHSLYLFDIEPENDEETLPEDFSSVSRVYCDGVDFLAGSPVAGSAQFITGDPFTADGYSYVYISNCHFGSYGESGASPANIRTRGDVDGVAVTKGVYVSDTTFEDFMVANAATNDLQDCHFTNISLGGAAFFLATLGAYSSMTNVQRRDGVALDLGDLTNKRVSVQNCTGAPDRAIGTNKLIERKALDVSSSGWVDLLLVGTRGTYSITVSGDDASTGVFGIGKVKISCSSNAATIYHSAADIEINAAELNLRWKDATTGALSTDRRTLQIFTGSAASNQFFAEVDIASRYIYGSANLTWLM